MSNGVSSSSPQTQGGGSTQRAYTLRLRPAIRDGDDPKGKGRQLQEALWATHEAINAGAKAFGEWLLTLRGGVDHSLAHAPGRGGEAPSPTEVRDRRVMLALSWLTVEDERGAPRDESLIVAYGAECSAKRHGQAERDALVITALREVLAQRGVAKDEIASWIADCQASLTARIRDDAVWVNRSAAWDAMAKIWKGLNRTNTLQTLADFFGDPVEWMTIPALGSHGEDEGVPSPPVTGAVARDEAPEFRTIARSFLSIHFGSGVKSDRASTSEALRLMAETIASLKAGTAGPDLWRLLCGGFPVEVPTDAATCKAVVLERVGWKGRPSSGRVAIETNAAKPILSEADLDTLRQRLIDEAEKKQGQSGKAGLPWIPDLKAVVAGKVGFGFVVDRDLIGEFGVMLDHAARRVSIVHSWIKRAELERRQFEADSAKLTALKRDHPAAVSLLDELRSSRGREGGSTGSEPILIRRRAIVGWKEVIHAWSRTNCTSVEDRVAAMRALQDELEKFGDQTLFERLAVDEARAVWRRSDGAIDPGILPLYVDGNVAQANQQRFKVPAYRHPDPVRAPVFGEFGNSRWRIDFAVHRRVRLAAKGKRVPAADAEYISGDHNMRLGLWTGCRVEDVELRWSSKRLCADLGVRHLQSPREGIVSRADRLGRAASGVIGATDVATVFSEEHWNGRLQAPRAELDRLARLLDKGKTEAAAKARERLCWLVTFSPKLTPAGPFIEYAARNGIVANRKGEYYPNADANRAGKREGQAKLILARLPSLRVLSVDLGHRFAAACAVWETLCAASFGRDVAGGAIVAGGVGPNDHYCHVRVASEDGGARTRIYRRVGADSLPDGTTHPAPWARLDRQFLVKLQGEADPPRRMSPAESAMLARWRNAVGASGALAAASPRDVAAGMAEGIRLLTLAIRRHADRARIARYLVATTRDLPGGRSVPLDSAGRVQLVAEALLLWHELFAGDRWTDEFARTLWAEARLPLLAAAADRCGGRPNPVAAGVSRRNARDAALEELRPHAERIVADEAMAVGLSKGWADRWTRDDRMFEHRGHRSGLLRELRRWVAPRGLRDKPEAARAARRVGGLGVDRINSITATYRLLKAFKNRPEPGDLRRNIPAKDDRSLARFHQRLLDVRDRLRDQRVKQLASRIVEGALGVGRIQSERLSRGAARPVVRVDRPCHVVVIESLTNYRPDELQTRRENRQLMEWSSAKVQKYLREGCELHGLHLREVQPNYTSRQCSRTGAPGLRCVQVSARDLLTGLWAREIDRAQARLDGGGVAALDRLLVAARQWAEGIPEVVRRSRCVVLPKRGGDLFVSTSRMWLGPNRIAALQADLNAAANIGLRAVLDPDWPGKWWFVPCVGGSFVPADERTRNAAVFEALEELPHLIEPGPSGASAAPHGTPAKRRGRGAASGGAAEKAIENRWRDVSAHPLNAGRWMATAPYWNQVQFDLCKRLQRQFSNGLENGMPGR